MGKGMLTIKNRHSDEDGPLPAWAVERPAGAYFGYFENDQGEQAVFLATPDAARFAYGGDWANPLEVRDPDWAGRPDKVVASMAGGLPILGKAEMAWIEACVRAACGRFESVKRGGDA